MNIINTMPNWVLAKSKRIGEDDNIEKIDAFSFPEEPTVFMEGCNDGNEIEYRKILEGVFHVHNLGKQ